MERSSGIQICQQPPTPSRQPCQDTEVSSSFTASDDPCVIFIPAADRVALSSWAWLFFASASLFPRPLYKSIYSCSPTYLNSCLFLTTPTPPISIIFFLIKRTKNPNPSHGYCTCVEPGVSFLSLLLRKVT